MIRFAARGASFRGGLSSAASLLLATWLGLVGCATLPSAPPSVGLRIESSRPDATVWVDDRLIGTAGDLLQRGGLSLSPGYHRVELRHPSCYSAYRDVELTTATGTQTLVVSLRPLVD